MSRNSTTVYICATLQLKLASEHSTKRHLPSNRLAFRWLCFVALGLNVHFLPAFAINNLRSARYSITLAFVLFSILDDMAIEPFFNVVLNYYHQCHKYEAGMYKTQRAIEL